MMMQIRLPILFIWSIVLGALPISVIGVPWVVAASESGTQCDLTLIGEGTKQRPRQPCAGAGYFCSITKPPNQGVCKCAFGEFEVLKDFVKVQNICDFVSPSTGGRPLITIAQILINIATALMVAVSIIITVVAGYVYMTAGGSAERMGLSKKLLGSALLGLILALTAWLILNTISPQFTSQLEEPFLNRPCRIGAPNACPAGQFCAPGGTPGDELGVCTPSSGTP